MITTLAILLFILLIALSTFLRTKSNGKYEVRISDAIFAIVPVIIILLLSGQISELQVGDLSLKLKEDLKKKIINESDLKSNTILDGKRSLIIGVDCDYAVEEDIIKSHPMPGGISYNYIVFQHNCVDDKYGNRRAQFWGIISYEDYKDNFLTPNSQLPNSQLPNSLLPNSQSKASVFLSWVKSKNINKLKSIPSFVNVENAITLNTDKLSVLEKMEALNVDFLPVINQEKIFLGVITKQRLTSSLMLNIATNLK